MATGPIDISPLGQSPEINYQAASTPDLGATYSAADVGETEFGQALSQSPLATLQRLEARFHDSSPLLDADQLNQQFRVDGPTPELSLSWKPGETMRRDTADQQAQLMRQRIWTQYVLGHAQPSWVTTGSAVAGDFLGSMVDPLNVAASFIPVGWLGRGAEAALGAARLAKAASLAREMGEAAQASFAGRTSAAALQNATGVALMQPLYLATAADDHEQYSFATAANNILFGGLLGGGLHVVGEAAAQVISRAAAILNPSEAVHPELAQDAASMSREQVIADLTRDNGAAPSEPEIQSEIDARIRQFQQNVAEGKYVAPQPMAEDQMDLAEAINRQQKALDSGDYAQAAEVARAMGDEQEKALSLPLDEAERAEVDAPVQRARKIRQLMDDFTQCVAEAVS